MAVIPAMPSRDTIIGLRGVLDFACWKGVNYVRAWPRSPSGPRSPAVQASAAAFADLSRRLQSIDATIQTEAKEAAAGSTWTWKDLTTAAQYGHVITWEA